VHTSPLSHSLHMPRPTHAEHNCFAEISFLFVKLVIWKHNIMKFYKIFLSISTRM
jgi:hypothetical protein